uniref:Anoctamin n=2 Tax=Clytia hemisphaerica TaxID=252671 RepID=A0A7M5WJ25_9CNID
GVLITSLWVPTILGIIVFVYGFIVAYNTKEKVSVEAVTGWVTKAFDNNATPYFAVIICLWGTVFCEYWKRTNALLAYKWDVDLFEEQETNRPQFIGTTVKKNPVSGEYEPHYPKWRKVLKSMGSMSIILFMVCLVVTSVVSVVVYKVVSRVDWFKTITNGAFASSMTSSVLNSISILLLGRLYKTLAYKLTEWENHQTKTKYEDALILKLFGFQFVNSYASLFYIAFFRQRTSEGVFNLGTEYSDSCGDNNDCMSLLSLQVAVLMIAKPMPKFFSDIILPFVMKYARKLCCCFKRQSTNVVSSLELQQKDTSDDAEYEAYLRHEHKKPPLDDFTLSEYTEKVLQYGYLMMFAAAFPLAPLIALITNLIDMRVDARRMLWFNRRPFAERAEDIGMWFAILNFLNYVGMLTNALILGLTSQYGNQYKMKTFNVNLPSNVTAFNTITNQTVNSFPVTIESNNNLWIILIFENVVLAVKFVIAYAIPDIPESVSEAKSQEKIQLGKLLMRSGLTLGPGKTIKPETKQKTKQKQRNKKNRSSLKRVDENSGPSKRKSVGFDVESEN